MTEKNSSFKLEVKIDPASLEKNEEALLVAGYVEQCKDEMPVMSGRSNRGNHKQVGHLIWRITEEKKEEPFRGKW